MRKLPVLILFLLFAALLCACNPQISDKACELVRQAIHICDQYSAQTLSAADAYQELCGVHGQLDELYDVETFGGTQFQKTTAQISTDIYSLELVLRNPQIYDPENFGVKLNQLRKDVGNKAQAASPVPMPTYPAASIAPGQKEKVVDLLNRADGILRQCIQYYDQGATAGAAKELNEEAEEVRTAMFDLELANRDAYSAHAYRAVSRVYLLIPTGFERSDYNTNGADKKNLLDASAEIEALISQP